MDELLKMLDAYMNRGYEQAIMKIIEYRDTHDNLDEFEVGVLNDLIKFLKL